MIREHYRPDGTSIGYDYGRQQWYDTSPTAERDPAFPAGTACNPLAARPDGPILAGGRNGTLHPASAYRGEWPRAGGA